MPYIRKIKDKWRAEVQIMVAYERFRDSRTFSTKAEAFAWGSRRKKELMMGQTDNIDTSKTLQDALSRYLKEVTPDKRSKKSESLRIKYFMQCKELSTNTRLTSLSPSV